MGGLEDGRDAAPAHLLEQPRLLQGEVDAAVAVWREGELRGG